MQALLTWVLVHELYHFMQLTIGLSVFGTTQLLLIPERHGASKGPFTKWRTGGDFWTFTRKAAKILAAIDLLCLALLSDVLVSRPNF